MISSFIAMNNTELLYLIATFAVSVLVHLSVLKMSFKDNVCFLITLQSYYIFLTNANFYS